MGIRIGIDVGTSNSSIAVYDGKTAAALPVSEGIISVFGGEKRLASAVYAGDRGTLILGQAAYNKRMQHPERFLSEFKRDFGSDVPAVLGNESYTIDDMYTAFFRKLVSFAEKHGTIDEAYITHPADYNSTLVNRLKKAAKLAGLYHVVTVDEPSAAAASYTAKAKLETGSIILVYDFGGGTFDASLIKKTKEGFVHLTKPLGLPDCGGSDFDRAIFEEILNRIRDAYGEDVEKLFENPRVVADFSERAVKIKHQLSLSENYTECFMIGYDAFECHFTRRELNEMICEQVDRTCELLKKLLLKANVRKQDVAKVLLVGGTCNIPYIKERLTKLFGTDKIVQTASPDLAVCIGAAQYKSEVTEEPTPEPIKIPEPEPMKPEPTQKKEDPELIKNREYELGMKYYHGDGVKADEKQAVSHFQTAAALGHAGAQYMLAHCCLGGIGIEKNEAKAVEWYQKSAEQGSADAYFDLGFSCYSLGVGVAVNHAKKIECYEKAASLGHLWAHYWLGTCYANGSGVVKNEKTAFEWYQKGAEKGDESSQYELGLCYEEGKGTAKDRQKALEWYQKAAEQDNEHAKEKLETLQASAASIQNLVDALKGLQNEEEKSDTMPPLTAQELYEKGEAFRYGKGVAVDLKQAVQYYEMAANQGHLWAQSRLAYCYEMGIGTDIDMEKAVGWYEKVAEREHISSQMRLADYYQKKTAAAEDFSLAEEYDRKAVFWYERAAKQGNKMAEMKLAEMQAQKDSSFIPMEYEAGKKQYQQAQYLAARSSFSSAAMKNCVQAQYMLGEFDRFGIGSSKENYGSMMRWYEQAAGKGHVKAQNTLGSLYVIGVVGKDVNKAFFWISKAAESGEALPLFNLGYYYEKGIGTVMDIHKAFSLYQTSAELGYPNAQYRLGYFYEKGFGTSMDIVKALEWYQKAAANGNEEAKKILRVTYHMQESQWKPLASQELKEEKKVLLTAFFSQFFANQPGLLNSASPGRGEIARYDLIDRFNKRLCCCYTLEGGTTWSEKTGKFFKFTWGDFAERELMRDYYALFSMKRIIGFSASEVIFSYIDDSSDLWGIIRKLRADLSNLGGYRNQEP